MECKIPTLLETIINDGAKDMFRRLNTKNDEYATPEDVFRNFIDGANLLGITPQEYALNLMTKHIISLKDLIISKSKDKELIFEKSGDIRAYITLIEGMYNYLENE